MPPNTLQIPSRMVKVYISVVSVRCEGMYHNRKLESVTMMIAGRRKWSTNVHYICVSARDIKVPHFNSKASPKNARDWVLAKESQYLSESPSSSTQ